MGEQPVLERTALRDALGARVTHALPLRPSFFLTKCVRNDMPTSVKGDRTHFSHRAAVLAVESANPVPSCPILIAISNNQ